MPHYDYRCQACQHLFEILQSISAAPLRKCPRCGKARLERLIGGGSGLLFKGTGFHGTDYKAGAPDPAAGSCGATAGGDCQRPGCARSPASRDGAN